MQWTRWIVGMGAVAMVILPLSAGAVTLPGAADSSRIQAQPAPAVPEALPSDEVPRGTMGGEQAPEGAKDIRFELRKVVIEGVTKGDAVQLDDLYVSMIGQTVGLDVAWSLAAQMTDRYKQAGYFLTRAYVPAQEVEGGVIRIRVVEGFIDEVVVSGKGGNLPTVKAWSKRIKRYRPITMRQLEQAILELNGLPNVSFRAILKPLAGTNAKEGAVALNLVASRKKGRGTARLDNHGSRYLGPYQLGLSYEMGTLPGQKTSASLLVSAPTKELKSGSLRHAVPLAPQLSLDVNGSYTSATPGYLLRIQDIKSDTYTVGLGLTYQWVRQRDENFSTRIGFEARNTQTDILNTPLVRDRVRALRAHAAYDGMDRWRGYNSVGITLSQGMAGFGATQAGVANLSRAEAKPNFRKLELMAMRAQALGSSLEGRVSVNGQVASGPLHSSEEFGYGGQAFGRAYDGSEITGDHGIAGSVELRYTDLLPMVGITPIPYVFYDIGKVWNEDAGQRAQESASSAGLGFRAANEEGLNANVGLAFPLTRDANDPLYSGNGKAPRLAADFSYEF